MVSCGSRRAECLELSLRPRVLIWRLVPGVGSEWAYCQPAQPGTSLLHPSNRRAPGFSADLTRL